MTDYISENGKNLNVGRGWLDELKKSEWQCGGCLKYLAYKDDLYYSEMGDIMCLDCYQNDALKEEIWTRVGIELKKNDALILNELIKKFSKSEEEIFKIALREFALSHKEKRRLHVVG